MARLALRNITLLNLAASDSTTLAGMTIPKFDTGLDNYYMAQLTKEASEFSVLCARVDGLALRHPISLVKIDAEGHEMSVLRGMIEVLRRDHPTLIVEDSVPETIPFLQELGYVSEQLEGSSNRVFRVG